jgi:NADH-ubiquinone oxidoreductase chain 5
MIINRVGDFGLALGIFAILTTFQSVEYSTVFALAPYLKDEVLSFFGFDYHLLSLVSFLLFIGAVGKSAQLGLHSWLPDAMEGPTPVSALIHAATMVTAGVFLLARCSPIFEYAPNTLFVVTIVGAMTAFFAATTGLLQNDLKRVIAFSTCSQLGYMIFACGLSNYSVGVFHLANNAFFKALLFMGAGSVIHAVGDEQDMRRMGGLKYLVPLTFSLMSIGSFALLGFPFLTGFYSKDVILEVAFAKYSSAGHFAYWLGTSAAFFTAFYSIRLTFLTFLSESNGLKPFLLGAHDAPFRMSFPLIILSIPSIFIGYMARDLFIGVGNNFWNNALFTLPSNSNIIDAEFMQQFFKLLPTYCSLFAAILAMILYTFCSKELYFLKTSLLGRKLYVFFNRKWLFDKIYNEYISQQILYFGYFISYKIIDRGIIEMLGPFGLSKTVLAKSTFLTRFHSGAVYDYSLWMFVGLIFLLLIFEFWDLFIVLIDPNLIAVIILTCFFAII